VSRVDDDVRAYLDRLGVEPEPPSVGALFRLHRAQVERVPYETTWIHMDERWSVDPRASLHRIARLGRGGYCFQLNGALSMVLDALGYQVTLHRGGVHDVGGPAEDRIDNHLVVLVHDLPSDDHPTGTWYVDAGLGDALHEPLPLAAGSFRQGPFEFELAVSDVPFADWRFHHRAGGSFAGMAFEARPARIDVFARRNTFLSTSPDSGFAKLVTVQRRDAAGIDVLRGQVLSRVEGTATVERTLTTRAAWFDTLAERFGLTLDDAGPGGRERLWRRTHATHEAWLASGAVPPPPA
jgi:N-hydroxyarylamine O-acetyltransferase